MMNTPRFVDTMAKKAGLRVFMPDYFHGQPWPKDKFPPKDLCVTLTIEQRLLVSYGC